MVGERFLDRGLEWLWEVFAYLSKLVMGFTER